jgi:hypothetical protein
MKLDRSTCPSSDLLGAGTAAPIRQGIMALSLDSMCPPFGTRIKNETDSQYKENRGDGPHCHFWPETFAPDVGM